MARKTTKSRELYVFSPTVKLNQLKTNISAKIKNIAVNNKAV